MALHEIEEYIIEKGKVEGITTQEFLQHAFEYVRDLFFPDWCEGKEWSVEFRPDQRRPFNEDIVAVFDPLKKMIHFLRVPSTKDSKPDYDRLEVLLIHEICHYWTKRQPGKTGHDEEWGKAMTKAYRRALKINPDLAEKIKFDMEDNMRRNP